MPGQLTAIGVRQHLTLGRYVRQVIRSYFCSGGEADTSRRGADRGGPRLHISEDCSTVDCDPVLGCLRLTRPCEACDVSHVIFSPAFEIPSRTALLEGPYRPVFCVPYVLACIWGLQEFFRCECLRNARNTPLFPLWQLVIRIASALVHFPRSVRAALTRVSPSFSTLSCPCCFVLLSGLLSSAGRLPPAGAHLRTID